MLLKRDSCWGEMQNPSYLAGASREDDSISLLTVQDLADDAGPDEEVVGQ